MTDLLGRQVSHRIPQRRKSIWEIETVSDMLKGVFALVMVGIGAGLIMITVRLMWEISQGYLDYLFLVARWTT